MSSPPPDAAPARLAAPPLGGPTRAGRTDLLFGLDGAAVARACWTALPLDLRRAWLAHQGEVCASQIAEYLHRKASPGALWIAAHNPELPATLRAESRRLLAEGGHPEADLRRRARHLERLLRTPRERLLRRLGTAEGARPDLDRTDALAEIVAIRQVEGEVRRERLAGRAFHTLFKVRHTTALWGLVGVLVATFAVESAASAEELARLLEVGALGDPRDRPWTLVTYALLHGSVVHLAFNVVALLLVGRVLELILGHALFAGLFAAGAVAAGLTSVATRALEGADAYTVGASGAIACLATLALALGVVFELRVGHVPLRYATGTVAGGLVLVTNILIGAAQGSAGVDHAAHLGGMAAGLALMGWFAPRLIRQARDVKAAGVGARRSSPGPPPGPPAPTPPRRGNRPASPAGSRASPPPGR